MVVIKTMNPIRDDILKSLNHKHPIFLRTGKNCRKMSRSGMSYKPGRIFDRTQSVEKSIQRNEILEKILIFEKIFQSLDRRAIFGRFQDL